VARAICAAGLLPSFGVYHHNYLNPFCLADDFLEPFRPLVDLVVYQLSQEKLLELTPEVKHTLADILWAQVTTSEGKSPVFQSMHYLCSSYTTALQNRKPELAIPYWEGTYEKLSDPEQV
jgi:CRISPR-associated protein Cas1